MDKYKEYYLHNLILFYERGKMYEFEEVIQSINTNLTNLYNAAKNYYTNNPGRQAHSFAKIYKDKYLGIYINPQRENNPYLFIYNNTTKEISDKVYINEMVKFQDKDNADIIKNVSIDQLDFSCNMVSQKILESMNSLSRKYDEIR